MAELRYFGRGDELAGSGSLRVGWSIVYVILGGPAQKRREGSLNSGGRHHSGSAARKKGRAQVRSGWLGKKATSATSDLRPPQS